MILVLFGGDPQSRCKLATEIARRSRTFHIPSFCLSDARDATAKAALGMAVHNAKLHKDVVVDLPELPEMGWADDDMDVSYAAMPGVPVPDDMDIIAVPDLSDDELSHVALSIIAQADLLAVH